MIQIKEEIKNSPIEIKLEPSNKNEKNIKQRRRTRNDLQNRDFTCGCGKSYLSYPALYTHLKQKHKGIQPEGTILPPTNGKGARGRPKVIFNFKFYLIINFLNLINNSPFFLLILFFNKKK